MEDTYLFEAPATILGIRHNGDGRMYILLNQSNFYPQGGGQPYDLGVISTDGGSFAVEEVRFQDGYTCHYGSFTTDTIPEGTPVTAKIDKNRRLLNARLHSAGHLLDFVYQELEGTLKPLKGFHFPEGPYVEYVGEYQGNGEALIQEITRKMNEYIALGFEVRSEIVASLDELKEKAYFIPGEIPSNKPIRVVTVFGDKGIPCGGTHVKNISEIGNVRVTKIKTKGGNTKFSYVLED